MTDVRRERIPLLWSTVGDTALAKEFYYNNYEGYEVSVCLQKNETAWKVSIHSEKVRKTGRRRVKENVTL